MSYLVPRDTLSDSVVGWPNLDVVVLCEQAITPVSLSHHDSLNKQMCRAVRSSTVQGCVGVRHLQGCVRHQLLDVYCFSTGSLDTSYMLTVSFEATYLALGFMILQQLNDRDVNPYFSSYSSQYSSLPTNACQHVNGINHGVTQIEELQAQESQLRAADAEGQGHGPISALLLHLGSSTPEETQDALQELLQAAAAAK